MRYSVTLLLTLGLMVVGSATAMAQEKAKVGDWAPDFSAENWLNVDASVGEDSPSLIRYRGLIVVLFYWTSSHDGGKEILPYMNLVAQQDFGTSAGVVMVGLTDADDRATQSLLQETMIRFPVGTGSKSAKERYGFQDSWGIVVIDTTGKVAFKGAPQALDSWIQQIQQILVKAPPYRTHPTEERRVVRVMDDLKKAIEKRDYRRAFVQFVDGYDRAVAGDKLKTEMIQFADLVDQEAYLKLREAEILVEKGKFDEAATLARQAQRQARGLHASNAAKRWSDATEKESDGYKDALGRYKSEETAFKLVGSGRIDLESRRVGEAEEKFTKVITEYPKSEAAKMAQSYIDRMKSISTMWTEVLNYRAKTDCTAWKQEALTFEKQKNYKEAEKFWRRILDTYPGTTYADEAVEALKKLPH